MLPSRHQVGWVVLASFAWNVICFADGRVDPSAVPTTLPSQVVGTLPKDVIESSGVVASRRQPGVLWTHNDSGNAPELFGMDLTGKELGRFRVDAPNVDWEDIAIDDAGHLYIADIGNNNARRLQVTVYRAKEPTVGDHADHPLPIERQWDLVYQQQPFNSESLFVWQDKGYIISKNMMGQQAAVWAFDLKSNDRSTPLRHIVDLPVRSPVTAADISADGKELAVMTVLGPNRFAIDGDVSRAAAVPVRSFPFVQPDLEAICFVPGGLAATTESGYILRFGDELFKEAGQPATSSSPATRQSR